MKLQQFLNSYGLTALDVRDVDEGQKGLRVLCEGKANQVVGSRHGIDLIPVVQTNKMREGTVSVYLSPGVCRQISELEAENTGN